MRKPLFCFVLSTLPTFAFAWDTPKQAITEFLKFELNGGRLSSDGWAEYTSKYIYAPDEYDEPGWDEVTVINSYSIKEIRCSESTKCLADVEFDLYPTEKLKGRQVTPHNQGGKEVVHYSLLRKNNSWRLDSGGGIPRVTPETEKKY